MYYLLPIFACVEISALLLALFQRKLPPILYLQCDNCFRENKNRYVLGFCQLLVEQKIFHEVKILYFEKKIKNFANKIKSHSLLRNKFICLQQALNSQKNLTQTHGEIVQIFSYPFPGVKTGPTLKKYVFSQRLREFTVLCKNICISQLNQTKLSRDFLA